MCVLYKYDLCPLEFGSIGKKRFRNLRGGCGWTSYWYYYYYCVGMFFRFDKLLSRVYINTARSPPPPLRMNFVYIYNRNGPKISGVSFPLGEYSFVQDDIILYIYTKAILFFWHSSKNERAHEGWKQKKLITKTRKW